jgi:hypothetical protein
MALNWRHYLIGFMVSVAYWPGILSAGFVPRWAAIAVLVPLFCTLQPKRLPVSVWGVLLFLFGCAGFSLMLSPDALTGTHDLMLAAILVLPFIAAASMETLDDIFSGMAVGLAASSALIIGDYFGLERIVQGRGFGGLLFNSEVLAEFSALVFVWAVVRKKWVQAALCAAPLLLCHSRISVLTVGAGLLYVSWLRLPRWLTVAAVAAISVAAVTAVFIIGDIKIATAFHRVTLWITAVMFLTPLGNGMGWAQVAFPVERFVHSDALQMLAEIGIPALAVLYIPWSIFKKKEQDIAVMAVFCGGCVQFLVSFPIHFPAAGFVLALVAGYLLRRRDVVCVGVDRGGTAHGGGVFRDAETSERSIGGCRGSGSTVPV